MSNLTLRYQYSRDGDDFGWLEFELRTENFAGRGGHWVQWQDLVELGDSLAPYPFPSEGVERDWGYREEGVDEIVLALRMKPANSKGDLAVHAVVADHYEPKRSLSATFTTHYPDVDRFRDGIARMMNREAEEAVLTGRAE